MPRLSLVFGLFAAVGLASLSVALRPPPGATPAPTPSPVWVPSDDCVPAPGGRLIPVAYGLSYPVGLTAPPGDPRVFILEQPGTVRVLRDGVLSPSPWLDLRSIVRSGGEQGLLGLAFHPQFATNGRVVVHHTRADGAGVLRELRVDPQAAAVDGPGREVLVVPQPWPNHNGGDLAFLPDGTLLVALGDGGAGGDPLGHGQNGGTWLGSILRVDLDGDPYVVPADNPFVGQEGFAPESYLIGLRNPWRIDVDPGTGDLWIGDVGQDAVEEIDHVPAGQGGLNLGWRTLEGDRCFKAPGGCSSQGLWPPAFTATHADGFCSITGGVVYRGRCVPDWEGRYFFSDYCQGGLHTLRAQTHEDVTAALGWTPRRVSSFGRDGFGELYVVDHGGAVYKLVAGSPATP